VPGEEDGGCRTGIDILGNKGFQDLFIHEPLLGVVRVQLFLFKIIAVPAIQVADGTNRFGHKVKWVGVLYLQAFHSLNYIIQYITAFFLIFRILRCETYVMVTWIDRMGLSSVFIPGAKVRKWLYALTTSSSGPAIDTLVTPYNYLGKPLIR
jgi:hypothetical protein